MATGSCRDDEELTNLRHILAVLDPVSERTQGQGLDLAASLLASDAIGKDAGQALDLGNQATVVLTFQFYTQHVNCSIHPNGEHPRLSIRTNQPWLKTIVLVALMS